MERPGDHADIGVDAPVRPGKMSRPAATPRQTRHIRKEATMAADRSTDPSMPRRDFLKHSALTVGAMGAAAHADAPKPAPQASPPGGWRNQDEFPFVEIISGHAYDGSYQGAYAERIAYPLGGLGAGMVCVEGTGTLSHVSLHNRPDVYNEPFVFAAVGVKGHPDYARVLEGAVPTWKLFGPRGTGNGASGRSYGLPRFRRYEFLARFPFAMIKLADPAIPLDVGITAWSPFEPNDADNASLPVAGIEYTITNTGAELLDAVFSFNSKNFMDIGRGPNGVRRIDGGFVLWEKGAADKPWEQGSFAVTTTDPAAKVNAAWFRGGWWDPVTMAWKDIREAACYDRPEITEGDAAPGASLFVPLALAPGASKTITVQLAWYCGESHERHGADPQPVPEERKTYYAPWYSARFASVDEVIAYWRDHYSKLRGQTERFSACFYDTTLPPEVVEAVATNLCILKSPTVLRQSDGRPWCYEGCGDGSGCCHGSCTHVWNYAQAICHLFPALERTLRETEFDVSQNEEGHQAFRTSLPIRPTIHNFHAAADGQLGGIMKMHREWRINGDTEWLRQRWGKVRESLDFCIRKWDPKGKGVLEEPHHNTYDIEFWGPDGMCSSFYLGALKAAVLMGKALGDDVSPYEMLYARGRKYVEQELFNGEYFVQKIEWKNLQAADPTKNESMVGSYSPEARELLEAEGPKYQYGQGCLADGVLGCWIAAVCGVGEVLDPAKVASHLRAVHKHNLRKDLWAHANPQRPSFACGRDGGLLLCTWPRGGQLSLPFVYSDEVWTGIEYQVASHLMLTGHVEEGLVIVRAARDRHDGRIRNPFDEYECGMLQGLSGARYDAIEKVLFMSPTVSGDFKSFLSTATGYGTIGVSDGKPFCNVVAGEIPYQRIAYTPRGA
jgi:uncharacterized protein (DUF608 family)